MTTDLPYNRSLHARRATFVQTLWGMSERQRAHLFAIEDDAEIVALFHAARADVETGVMASLCIEMRRRLDAGPLTYAPFEEALASIVP